MQLIPGRQRLTALALLCFGLCTMGLTVANWYTQQTANAQLETQITTLIPSRLTQMEAFGFGYTGLTDLQIENIQRDLQQIKIMNFYNANCEAWLQTFDGVSLSDREPGAQFTVSWEHAAQTRYFDVAYTCNSNSSTQVLAQFLLAFFFSLFILAVPKPLSARQHEVKKELESRGCDTEFIRANLRNPAVYSLSDEQLGWLSWAAHAGYDIVEAIAIAKADPGIAFDAQHSSVTIHGVTIELQATPFIYYYWYALCRVRSDEPEYKDGWFTNPPSNRPDRDNADKLINIMTAFGGHKKAINDLEAKGLRAKTLDQNRSKLKDELTAALGEELAATYLFEVKRDVQTARYRYRLSIEPTAIKLLPDVVHTTRIPFPKQVMTSDSESSL